MADIVLRVRLLAGDHFDVTFRSAADMDDTEAIEHVIETLAARDGVLRTMHGDRLLVLYARGVAAVEVAPRGAVL